MELAARDKLIEDNIRLVGYFTGQYARKLAGKLDYDEVYSAANFGLVKAADLYEPGRGTFSTFVGLCIWHRCLMDLRDKRKDALTVSLDAPLPGDTDNLALADIIPDTRAEFEDTIAENDRLRRFMAILSPKERKMLLDHANGVTQKALGEQLGIAQSYVSRKLKRIRQKEVTMEKITLAQHAEQYNAARADGMNPDEAAQAAGWKNYNSAQACCNKAGIKISAKIPDGYIAPKAAVIEQDFEAAFPEPDKPEPVNEIPASANETPVFTDEPVQNMDKPCEVRTLRPCCWCGKDFQYTDTGDCIVITPLNGKGFQLSYDALKQFSEEINELLEIIK